jgi:hypothetical protein
LDLVATYFLGKLVLSHTEKIRKVKRGIEVQKEKKNLENGIDELLENALKCMLKLWQNYNI